MNCLPVADKKSPTERADRLLMQALRSPGRLPGLSVGDWELLLRVARRARLLGRLEADLSKSGLLGEIPPGAANHLCAARHVIEHRRTLVSWETNRILWALKGLDVPVILLKGAAYVMAGLPSAPGRLFADVDLLIPEGRILEVEARLVSKGWFKMPIDPYDDRYYRVWMHEIPPLRHRERGTEIDIHHRLVPKTSRFHADPGPLFEESRPIGTSGLKILSPTDMVLHALLHLFLEGDPREGLRLRDLLDVHDLLCHFGERSGFWEGLVPRAREMGWERPLFYGLRFAQRLFETPIPQSVLAEARCGAPTWPLLKLMDGLVPRAMLPGHPDFPSLAASLARWLLYLRSHWLRMPAALLARHLGYKAYLRLRGVGGKADLSRLDLRQQ